MSLRSLPRYARALVPGGSAHDNENELTGQNPRERQINLQQALHTLRRIRRRYEIERTAHPNTRSNVHVALGDSDMIWITATIEALEKPIAAGATEADHLAWQLECARRLRDILSRPAQGCRDENAAPSAGGALVTPKH